jgi:hypothetical protein
MHTVFGQKIWVWIFWAKQGNRSPTLLNIFTKKS